ncbi:MAG: LLM class F420-dependent oxidoreductase, partial [Chloroflexota bacterium]
DLGGVRAYAQAAQDLGFEYMLTADHVLGADPAVYPGWDRPYRHDTVIHEPMMLFAYLAGVAPKLGFMPNVIILPQRQAVLVAKQAAELDLITGGNFRLGVGIGWNAVEFEGLGMDFKNRARRFEEQIDLMRRLWTETSMSYQGQYHTITGAAICPLPVQRPIPIWIGASAEPAVKRATRIADGFIPLRQLEGTTSWDATMAKVHSWVLEAGRDPSTFGIEARVSAGTGTPDEWRSQAELWRRLGASHLGVGTSGGGLVGADAHIQRLREVRQVLDA